VDFSEALKLAKDGERVRRALWRELGGQVGTHMEIRDVPGLGTVMVCPGTRKNPGLFACSQRDLLAEDWELAEEAP
jgi:hypothetical protein